MFSWVLTYCIIYLILFFIGRIGIHLLLKNEKQLFDQNDSISLEEITLLIPFRNEEKRIKPLLESLLNSTELPKEIIFIDDHSTDQSIQLIESTLYGKPFRIVKSDENGKKAAIQLGVSVSETTFMLTMDADVWFNSNYFTETKQLKQSDLCILPVSMKSKGWQKIFELDVYMANSINIIASGLKHPIMASGANLLFKKAAYTEHHSITKHQHILSGDDQFLLADFVQNDKEIHVSTNANLSITTPSPSTVSELIAQRLRWIQKTPFVPDSFALKIGIIQLTVTVIFLLLSLGCIIEGEFMNLLILFAIKTILDILLVSPYLIRIKKLGMLSLLPVYEIIFPFYTLFLAFLSLFYQPKWKGRKTIA